MDKGEDVVAAYWMSKKFARLGCLDLIGWSVSTHREMKR